MRVDVEAVIDELKSIALRESRVPSGAPYANLVKLNVDSIKRWGRLFEMELLMRDKLTRPSSMFDDVGMGLKMMRKGKLSLLPARGADKMAVDRMAKAAEAINRARAHQRPQGGQR